MTGKKFVVIDIDGTLVRWQLYHAIADSLVKLGYTKPEMFEQIKEARMVWKRREHKESFREYELQLVQLFTSIMLEVSVEQFETAASLVFEEYRDQVYTFTRDFIKELKPQDYLVFAISGSQEQIISKMAEYYGFDDYICRSDEQKDGRFTGKSTTPIFAKDEALGTLVSKHSAIYAGSYGLGDSHSDIKMLELVDNPIAFNPERRLYEYAAGKQWKIVVERKNLFYELQAGKDGYRLVNSD